MGVGRFRWAAVALGVALLALVLAGAWLVRLGRGPGPRSGDVAVPGLGAPVEVLRDSFAIPHVWASSVEDALFAQGYLHASDRLWQMEQFRRVATGRLSELLGEVAVESDRFLRTLGMARAAERGLPLLCAVCRDRLEAYVAGVNAALEEWQGPLPPELAILGVVPEPWTVADALAIEKVMAWDLAEYDVGLLLADAQRRGGEAVLDAVWPRYPAGAETILGGEAGSPEPRQPRAASHALPEELLAAARVPELARGLLESASVLRASNAWVVGGSRSGSGKPLLANDMHLALGVPATFHLMGLHAPGMDVVGVTIPGNPGVVAGHSAAVAWGFSNAGVDDVDFFIERVDPADTTRYLIPGGSEPFQVRAEEIRVRGREEPLVMRVRETRHGPIVTGVEPRAGSELLALRWAAHDPSTSSEAILRMNMARSAKDLLNALRLFRDPHQNMVFADTAGTFGYWMGGRVPLRRNGRPPLLPVPGWTDEHEWTGDLPFDEHPHAIDPASGFVVTANQRQTPDPGAELITDGTWEPPYRARRITELLNDLSLHDAASTHAIQMDVVSAFALKHREVAATAFREADEGARADSLREWDGAFDRERREPVYFYAWMELVRFRLARELYGGPPGYFPMSALDRMLEESRVSPSITTGAVREAVANAAAYRWGEAHLLQLDHLLAPVRALGGLLGFGRRDIPIAGDPYTVYAATHTGRFPPFAVRHGVSQRHVVDLADPDGSGGFILPGGQSGFPRSPHAFDQLPRWIEGGLVPLPLARSRVEARAVSQFRLVPAATPPP